MNLLIIEAIELQAKNLTLISTLFTLFRGWNNSLMRILKLSERKDRILKLSLEQLAYDPIEAISVELFHCRGKRKTNLDLSIYLSDLM